MSEQVAAAEGRLEHFPVSFFAMVMGLAGLTLGLHKLDEALGLGTLPGTIGLIVTIAACVVIGAFYLVKLIRHPKAVAWEWNHPVRIAFFPTISISILLIATASLSVWPQIAAPLWWVGIVLQLVLLLAVISAWIGHRKFETPHMNPAWFIPAVGNILVPIVGTSIGQGDISWFFFAVGLIFWIVLLTLVFNRLIFHSPLPERLAPTLMILIAPPAVGFLSYLRLNAGTVDGFARILYFGGVFFTLILLTQVGKLAKLPFMLSWWAYSFPLAALTVSTFTYGAATKVPAYQTAGYVVFAVLALVILMLLVRTAKAVMAGEICKPE